MRAATGCRTAAPVVLVRPAGDADVAAARRGEPAWRGPDVLAVPQAGGLLHAVPAPGRAGAQGRRPAPRDDAALRPARSARPGAQGGRARGRRRGARAV